MSQDGCAPAGADRPITVLVPVFNAAATIAATLANLTEQQGAEFSIHVYDDGSTDATSEILQEFARTDPRVILGRGAENRGRGYARNALLEMAAGHLVAWQDGDDSWSPGKLAAQVGFYRRQVAASGEYKLLVLEPVKRLVSEAAGARARHFRPPGQLDVHHVFGNGYRTYPFQLQAVFGPVEVFAESGGFDPELNWAEDFDILLKILSRGFCVFGNSDSSESAYYRHSFAGARPMIVEACQKRITDRHRDFAAAHGYDLDRIYALRGAEYLAHMYRGQKRYKEAFRVYQKAVAACDFDKDRDRIEATSRHILEMLSDLRSRG